MKSNRLISLIIFLLLVTPLFPQEQVIRIIANADINETVITSETVRSIFLGKKVKWENGDQIIIVTLDAEAQVHEQFLKLFIKKTPYSFTNFWQIKLFTGKGVPPISFPTEEDVIHYVAATQGAVGYISASHSENDLENVKILRVINYPENG